MRLATMLAAARGYGATLSRDWPVRLVYSTTSRLLVDLNRSVRHPHLHGRPIRALDAAARRAIVEQHHTPYRSDVGRLARAAIDAGARVVHLSCHSFTPELHGRERDADIGLLFDPRRAFEARVASAWRVALVAGPAASARRDVRRRAAQGGRARAARVKTSCALLRSRDERASTRKKLALITPPFVPNAGRLRNVVCSRGGKDDVQYGTSLVMAAQRIIHLCNNVELLAYTLEKLNARGRGGSAQAVLLRMKLAALTVELVSADLIERARQSSAIS